MFVKINEIDFEFVLSNLGKSGYKWKRLDEVNAKENVYMVSINDIHIKIFSSIVNGVSRSIGSDAIRVVGWDDISNRPIMSSEMRVNRTKGWINNLKNRIDNVVSKIVDLQKCKICGGTMVEMNGKFGKFVGCLNYKSHLK